MELYVGLAAMSTCSCAALCSAARVGDGHVQWGKYPACVRKKEECRQAILDDMPSETAVHRASERTVIPTDGAGSSHDGCAFQQPGGDTLCMETRSGVKRQDLHMQNDTWITIGISTPIWLPQVKDGDIRLRWTFLAPAPDDAARSAAVNIQTWRRLTT